MDTYQNFLASLTLVTTQCNELEEAYCTGKVHLQPVHGLMLSTIKYTEYLSEKMDLNSLNFMYKVVGNNKLFPFDQIFHCH